MSDEESVKKLAEIKAYLEKRMAELQDAVLAGLEESLTANDRR